MGKDPEFVDVDMDNADGPAADASQEGRRQRSERDEGPSEADIEHAERVATAEQAAPGRRGVSLWQWPAVAIGIAMVALLLIEALPAFLGGRGQASPVLTEATVTAVIDARTIEVEANGRRQTVRLIGVGLPDREDTLWWTARDAVRQEVEGRRVLLERDALDRDEEGRLLRYVYVDEVMLNGALLLAGLARSDDPAGNAGRWQDLLRAEADARAAGRGVWSRPRLGKLRSRFIL